MMKLKKLKVGQTAPNFNKKDIFGRNIDLSEYKDEKLLLCFFRYAGCPWCNLAIHHLTLSYPLFEKQNLKVIVFIQSKPENIKKYIIKRHNPSPKFPIIADPERTIYNLYGVDDSLNAAAKSLVKLPSWVQSTFIKGLKQGKIDGSFTLVPAQFLIGPRKLKIYKVKYGVDYYDHLPFVDVMDFAMFGGD